MKRALTILLCFFFAAVNAPAAEGPVSDEGSISSAKWEHLVVSIIDPVCHGCDASRPDSLPAEDDQTETELALTVRMENTSETRKIDLSPGLNLELEDEYENRYRWKSENSSSLFSQAGAAEGSEGWSLYPGEIYEETFVFEPPVPMSRALTMHLDLAALGAENDLQLELPVSAISGWPQLKTPRLPTEDDLTIEFPQDGTQVRAGQSVIVQIRLADELKRPDSIMILSPETEIKDEKVKGRYILTVPKKYRPGPFTVVIIAQWDAQGEVSVSKGLTLEVIAPDPCWDKCDDLPAQAKS